MVSLRQLFAPCHPCHGPRARALAANNGTVKKIELSMFYLSCVGGSKMLGCLGKSWESYKFRDQTSEIVMRFDKQNI